MYIYLTEFVCPCPDKNECELAQDNCHSNATCRNVVGSFMCTCNDGFEGNGTSCVGEKQNPLQRPVSHRPSITPLKPTHLKYPMYNHKLCRSKCIFIFVLCPDKNECELAQDDCHSNATCHNVVGSFMCTCNDGFEGNGTTCIGEKQKYTG